MEAVLQVLGDVGRVQPRHHEGQECDVRLVRHRRRDATVIVAGNHEHAARGGAAVGIAVLERITGPVDTGSFAIPDTEHAIDLAVRIRLDLLRAQHGRRREVLVYGRQEFNVMFGKLLPCPPQFQVVRPQWRAPVAADKTGRVQTGLAIQHPLHHRQPHQRLGSRQEYPAMLA